MPPAPSVPPDRQSQVYRAPIIIALVVVVGLTGWLTYYISYSKPMVDQTLREQFVWQLVDAPPLPEMARRTTVTLAIAGTSLPAGTYPGICTVIDGVDTHYLSGELSGVVCRTSESGTEIGIFKEGEQLVLKRGAIVGAEGRGENFAPITKEQV